MNYPHYYLLGMVSITADGYGQLKLPWGTFNNVIRLKIVQSTGDSVNFSTPLTNDVTSYVWYDNRHSGFLFRIDSSRSGSETMISAQYLISETNDRLKKK